MTQRGRIIPKVGVKDRRAPTIPITTEPPTPRKTTHQNNFNPSTPITAKALAKKIDELYELQLKCDEADAAKKAADKAFSQLEEELIQHCEKSELDGAVGVRALVKIERKPYPTVAAEDWPKVWAHIKKTGEFELLQKRISVEAVRERWNAGKTVSGVTKFTKIALKCLARKS